MSVELRIELPSYAHSFVIQVQNSCTITDVKQEIFRTCIGKPRVEGQRLIWRGRYLLDYERVDELWKSVDEPRIVHLAVHPSAWSSQPPEIPSPPQTSSIPPANVTTPRIIFSHLPQARPRPINLPQASTSQAIHPLSYVSAMHKNALLALTQGRIVPSSGVSDLNTWRTRAVEILRTHGWSWPSILDDPFPIATEGGLKYDHVLIAGQSYLSLRNPSDTPTPLQVHALEVLTYTFTILSSDIPITDRTFSSQAIPIPHDVNQVLQQFGLPQLRVAHNHNGNHNPIFPEFRQLPLRPLLLPLLMLVFRTLLLLYFVAPARKPVFGVLIIAWVLYEIYRPIRNVLLRGLARPAAEAQQQQNPAAQQNQNLQPNPQQGLRPAPNPPGGTVQGPLDNQAAALLDNLANININAEEQIVNDAPGTMRIEPGLGHKITTFLALLVTTIHPGVWNRRRVALRRREGRVRTEMSMRDAPAADTEGEETQDPNRTQLRATHTRRPRWVQNYMTRVVNSDWVDDAD